MPVRRIMLTLAVVGLLQGSAVVQAQYSSSASPSASGSSRQGMFGNRTMGSGARVGRGGSSGANDALNTPSDLAGARFVRGNRQADDVVGRVAPDAQRWVGGVQDDTSGGNWMQSLSDLSSGGLPSSWQNANRSGQRSGGEPAGQSMPAIRTTFRAAFEYSQPAPDKLSESLTRRLAGIPAIQTQTPLRVGIRGRTAVLRGTVPTEHARLLAEQILRLEPGVDAVRNEIVVEKPTSAEPTPP
jgi:hypothetical protein